MIKREMLRHDSMATAWWFLAEDEEPTVPRSSMQRLSGCDDVAIFDGAPKTVTRG
jgi:hypothetical protein